MRIINNEYTKIIKKTPPHTGLGLTRRRELGQQNPERWRSVQIPLGLSNIV